MEYISTRNTKKTFSFKDVFLKGLASEGGLFVPKKIPSYSSQELEKFKNLSYEELAVKIILKFCEDEFNEKDVKDLVKSSYKNFRVNDGIFLGTKRPPSGARPLKKTFLNEKFFCEFLVLIYSIPSISIEF